VRLLDILAVSFSDQSPQETLGVPVVSYAETNDFPAFYTRRSGLQVRAHQMSVYWLIRSTVALEGK
jgi:pseudouridine-5'-phosphate glycosidase